MTFLMHAVNTGCTGTGVPPPTNIARLAARPPPRSGTTAAEGAPANRDNIGGPGLSSLPPQQQGQSASAVDRSNVEDRANVDRPEGGASAAQADASAPSPVNGDDETAFLDPCVPVVKSALEFAVKSMCNAEVRWLHSSVRTQFLDRNGCRRYHAR